MGAPAQPGLREHSQCGRQPSFLEVWPTFSQLVGEAVVNPVCPGSGTVQPLT